MQARARPWTKGDKLIAAALVAISALALLFAAGWLRHEPGFTRVVLPGATAAAPAGAPQRLASPPDSAPAPDATDAPGSAAAQLTAAADAAAAAAAERPAGAAPVAAPAVDPRLGTPLIATRFDLSRPGSGEARVEGDSIVIRKALRYGGTAIGDAAIHVDGRSRLLVDVAELRQILRKAGLDSAASGLRQEQGLATFVDLRRQGIDLRYDPGADTIELAV